MKPSFRLAIVALAAALPAADWPQFRGPNGSGVAEVTRLPVQFGPARGVAWKTALPPGHSSPVLAGDRIFLTAAEGGARSAVSRDKVVDAGGHLWTYCLDRKTGAVLW